MSTEERDTQRRSDDRLSLDDLDGIDSITDTLAFCENCELETTHSVHLNVVSEGRPDDARGFDREPYRTETCRECGDTTREAVTYSDRDGGDGT